MLHHTDCISTELKKQVYVPDLIFNFLQ